MEFAQKDMFEFIAKSFRDNFTYISKPISCSEFCILDKTANDK